MYSRQLDLSCGVVIMSLIMSNIEHIVNLSEQSCFPPTLIFMTSY